MKGVKEMDISIRDKKDLKRLDYFEIDLNEFNCDTQPIHEFMEKLEKLSQKKEFNFRISFGY